MSGAQMARPFGKLHSGAIMNDENKTSRPGRHEHSLLLPAPGVAYRESIWKQGSRRRSAIQLAALLRGLTMRRTRDRVS